MGASHEISPARAEDLPNFPPGNRRLRRQPFTVGKGELRVTLRLQGGVHVPPPVLKLIPLPGSEDSDRAAGGAIHHTHRASWRAVLLGEVLRDLLPELLWRRLVTGRPARPQCQDESRPNK